MAESNDHHTPTQKFFRVATWVLGLAILVIVIFVVTQQLGEVEQHEDRTIENLVGQWKSAGLSVGNIRPTADPLGAMRAGEVDVDGKPVIVYQFDPLNPAQLKARDKIKADGTVVIDGRKTPALVNGPFVLARYEGHPDQNVLVETFQAFGTFEGIKAEQKLDMPAAK